jgi:serine/threonine protein kinase
MGILHRDIKPANLLVDSSGNLWITDFGLAQMGQETQLTVTGDLLGTLQYLSPESAQGGARAAMVDHRTDVYSLGATLYELLTLQPAINGEGRPDLLRKIVEEEPKPLRTHDRRIPIELETIVLKAMEKNPSDRYATAGELAADLRRFLEDRPITARRPTAWDRTRKWSRRHRRPLLAAALILIAATSARPWPAGGLRQRKRKPPRNVPMRRNSDG